MTTKGKIITTVVVSAVGVAVAVLVAKKFKLFFNKLKQVKNVQDELKDAEKKTPLSYPLSQYDTFANVIETACFDVGTDEDAILKTFYKLNNNADYLQLTKAWGNPTRRIYDWLIPMDFTLPQQLRYELSDYYCTLINNILAKKNITYRV